MFYSKSTGGFYDPRISAGKIPGDAVEITAERHQALLQGQSEGQRITADENGYPVLADRPVPSLDERRTAAKTAIDTEAGNARARFVSAGQLVAEEYLQAERSAQAWDDSGRPADQVPGDVQAWADAAGMTPEQAAEDILTTAASWRTLITTIRQVRLGGKAAVDAATDQGTADDMATAAQPFIDQLRAIKPDNQ